MEFFFGVVVFIFGLIIGSFLNVVVLRLGTGKGFLGRSFCMSCGTQIKEYDLLPVFSFLFLRGRCRHCKTRISWQYPLVEFVTGLVFLSVYLRFAATPSVSFWIPAFWYFVFTLLVAIAVYDIKHQVIPDSLSYLFSLSAIIYFVLTHNLFVGLQFPWIFNTLAGVILFAVFALLWFVSTGRWIGFGDAKLVLGMGFALGLSGSLSAIAFAFWSGALWSIGLLLSERIRPGKRKITFKSAIPFAPFLIFGFYLAFLLSPDIFSLNALLFGNF